MFTIIYTKVGTFSVVVDLTCPEIGKSIISRVNNDVTLYHVLMPFISMEI